MDAGRNYREEEKIDPEERCLGSPRNSQDISPASARAWKSDNPGEDSAYEN